MEGSEAQLGLARESYARRAGETPGAEIDVEGHVVCHSRVLKLGGFWPVPVASTSKEAAMPTVDAAAICRETSS